MNMKLFDDNIARTLEQILSLVLEALQLATCNLEKKEQHVLPVRVHKCVQ